MKQAAVGYLASFTARGAQLSSEQVQTIAETFLNYIDHYRATHASCRGPDVRRYGQYYAYFQGLLYVSFPSVRSVIWGSLTGQDFLLPVARPD